MKSLYSILVIAFISSASYADTLLIENITVISPERTNPLRGANVLIDNGIIKSLNYKGRVDQIFDGTGKYLTPGFIDSHVHIGHTIALKDEHFESKPALVNSYFSQLPKSYLYFGFTTLIDPDLKTRNMQRFNNASIKPDLLSCGRGIRYLDGYGQSLFPKNARYKIFPNWVYDKWQELPAGIDKSQHTVSASVDTVEQQSGICVKTYHEDGFGGTFDWQVPSDELISEIVSESRSRNLPVMLHSTSLEAYKSGINAKVDIFAHGIWHWKGNLLDTSPDEQVDKLLKVVAIQGSYVQSTMRVLLGELDTYIWKTDDKLVMHALHPDFIHWVNSTEGKWPQQALAEMYNKHKPNKAVSSDQYIQSSINRVNATVKLAFDNGVKLILGSDTPASEGIGNVPGLNSLLEIRALYNAGVSLPEIFNAVTLRNAEAFKLNNEIGSVEVGKKANLVILAKNPLVTIDAYDSITNVILSGALHDRNDLSAKKLN